MKKDKEKKGSIDLKDIKVKDLKPFAVPTLTIFVLIILSFFTYRYVSGRIVQQRVNLSTARKNEEILTEKLRILSDLSVLSTDENITALNAALPNTNSALMMLSQIKNIVSTYGISLSSLNISQPVEEKTGTSRIEMNFDIEGGQDQIFSFINSLYLASPVKKLRKFELISVGGVVRGEITMSVFYAPFPTKIPPVSEPVKDFTLAELETLTLVSSFSQPDFVELEPQLGIGRPDPFQ